MRSCLLLYVVVARSVSGYIVAYRVAPNEREWPKINAPIFQRLGFACALSIIIITQKLCNYVVFTTKLCNIANVESCNEVFRLGGCGCAVVMLIMENYGFSKHFPSTKLQQSVESNSVPIKMIRIFKMGPAICYANRHTEVHLAALGCR